MKSIEKCSQKSLQSGLDCCKLQSTCKQILSKNNDLTPLVVCIADWLQTSRLQRNYSIKSTYYAEKEDCMQSPPLRGSRCPHACAGGHDYFSPVERLGLDGCVEVVS